MAQGTRGVKKDYAKMSKGNYQDDSTEEEEVDVREYPTGSLFSPVRSFKGEIEKQNNSDEILVAGAEKDDEERKLQEQLQGLERKKKELSDKKQEELREKRKEALREKIKKAKEELESIESGSVIENREKSSDKGMTSKLGKDGKKGKIESTKKTEKDTGIDISDLRTMKLLNEVVDKKMADLGLEGSSEESSD